MIKILKQYIIVFIGPEERNLILNEEKKLKEKNLFIKK